MKPIFKYGGGVAGYIVACLIYGRLLPALSKPAIIGVIVGQLVLMVAGLIASASAGMPGVAHLLSEEESRKQQAEREAERRDEERESEKRYGSWSTDDLIAGVTVNQQLHSADELRLMKREIRRRKRQQQRNESSATSG